MALYKYCILLLWLGKFTTKNFELKVWSLKCQLWLGKDQTISGWAVDSPDKIIDIIPVLSFSEMEAHLPG